MSGGSLFCPLGILLLLLLLIRSRNNGRPLPEDAALNFAAVVLQRVVRVSAGGMRRAVRVPVLNGLVDCSVFLDGFRRVPADRALQPDRGGLRNGAA